MIRIIILSLFIMSLFSSVFACNPEINTDMSNVGCTGTKKLWLLESGDTFCAEEAPPNSTEVRGRGQ